MSAEKALAIAAAEGQKIFTITQANAKVALPKLSINGDMRSEFESVVAAGKEVTVHERRINAHGYSGYGYVIIDPETGTGAYLIEGRGNGAIMATFGVAIGATIIASTTITVASGGMAAAALAVLITQLLPLILLAAVPIMALWTLSPTSARACFMGGLFAGLTGGGLIAMSPAASVVAEIGDVLGFSVNDTNISECVLGWSIPLGGE
ncbi:MAG: hypothetical protein PHO57_10665 [Acidithiobacillus sp.]|nr:hypothetical protein [Acidithiobacillus sp.]